jgi:hypothetical protein
MTSSDDPTRGTVVLLNTDLFFGVRVRQVARDLGFAFATEKTTAGFFARLATLGDEATLGLIDIGAQVDWDAATSGMAATTCPVLAFGPHMDVDGLRAAKAAGVTRVFSNGEFSREMGALIERYARPSKAG